MSGTARAPRTYPCLCTFLGAPLTHRPGVTSCPYKPDWACLDCEDTGTRWSDAKRCTACYAAARAESKTPMGRLSRSFERVDEFANERNEDCGDESGWRDPDDHGTGPYL